MERFRGSQRESVLLGYDNDKNSLIRRSSSSNSNLEVDFTDVFGGPPRRSSITEARQSVDDWSGEEGERGWCRWPREREKPVFGEDSGNRSRHPNPNNSSDFFGDIFGGGESASACSTPKNRVGDPFTFSPRLSPAPHPLVASLPSTFNLPAKLTNGVDLPTFGSPTMSKNPFNDGIVASNGSGLSDSHISRFSTQRKELKNDLKPCRQSLLSQEFSNSSTSDKADKGSIMKQDISISEVSSSACNDLFHFSIYKWASNGVPTVMPLRTERASRNKDKVKLERYSSTKDWLVGRITAQNPIADNGFPLKSDRKQDVLTPSNSPKNGADSNQLVEQIVSAKAQSDTSSSLQTFTKDVPASSFLREARAVESSNHSTREKGFSAKTDIAGETKKLEPKPLHFLFEESDKIKVNDEMITRESEENRMKSTKKLSAVFDVTVNPMKQEEKTVSLRHIGHSKANSKGTVSLDENNGKGVVKGKVKEFARIFNQEAVTKPKVDSKSRPQGSTHKKRDPLRAKNVEGGPEQSKKDNSAIDTTNTCANNLSHQDYISEPDISFTVIGDKDEAFPGSFMIQVLSQEEVGILQNEENQEIQMIDNKIQQWSKGKEGNIRSLLSTLQYVLWPECGWKPVPLVDIIEGNAVKRSYQRALLCLHPDKLQQKGSSSDQKYIAEKIFDILQEAWTQFNMLGL